MVTNREILSLLRLPIPPYPHNKASWVRTNVIQQSKCCALPLGDSPVNNILNYYFYFENFTESLETT